MNSNKTPMMIPNLAPLTYTKLPSISLPMTSTTNYPTLSTFFKIPPIPPIQTHQIHQSALHLNIPFGLMNDLPLPPDLKLSNQQPLPPSIMPILFRVPNNNNNSNNNLPLGHPGRIKFIDTISAAFTDKHKKQKRSVTHRSWARAKKCGECNKTYPSTDGYELHRMVYHSEGIEINHPCPICGRSFNERRWLNRHVRDTHFKFMCKIDGFGNNQINIPKDKLKNKKGKYGICGYRFNSNDDLIAHQAIIHNENNEFAEHSDNQGVTIQFMNGTDAKNIVIQRLVWKKDKNNNHNNNNKGKEKKKKKKSKKSKKSKRKLSFDSDIPPCIEVQPMLKKCKLDKHENEY